MARSTGGRGVRPSSLVLGVVLIGLGLLFAAIELFDLVFDVDVGRYLWPFFVIVPGVLLLAAGVTVRGDAGPGLVIAGSVVSTTGLLLFFHSVTGWWATWAYAWALIAPTSVGVAMTAFGLVRAQQQFVKPGLRLVAIGAILFVVGFVFFELILDISGFGLGRLGTLLLAVLLIGLGIGALALGLLRSRKE
jgi:hypothetical protein